MTTNHVDQHHADEGRHGQEADQHHDQTTVSDDTPTIEQRERAATAKRRPVDDEGRIRPEDIMLQDETTARWRIVDDNGAIIVDGFETNAVAWRWHGLTRIARMIVPTPTTNGASAPMEHHP